MERSRAFAEVVTKELDYRARSVMYWDNALQQVEKRGEWWARLRYGRSEEALRKSYTMALKAFLETDLFCLSEEEEKLKNTNGGGFLE